jgi:hypothetical protein
MMLEKMKWCHRFFFLQNFESIRCGKVELIGNENGDIQLYKERVHHQHENAIETGIEREKESWIWNRVCLLGIHVHK